MVEVTPEKLELELPTISSISLLSAVVLSLLFIYSLLKVRMLLVMAPLMSYALASPILFVILASCMCKLEI